MPRRIAYDTPPNRERWLVSYADFITLLFGFFVVMYAVSSVNEGKYQELTASLIEVFDTPQSSLNPIQFGEISRMSATQMIELPNSSEFAMVDRNAKPTQHSDVTPNVQTQGNTGDTVLEEISSQVKDEFKELIEQQQLRLHGDADKISIELNSNVLFASGRSDLSRQAVELFEEIGDLLKTYENPIAVEGYTDSQKINTGEYQSNWELSAARAAAVARVLEQNGVQEQRLTATGMGAKDPIADNADEQGRRLNRRVVLVINKTVIKKRAQTKTQLAAADVSEQTGSIDEQGFVSDEASSINAPQVNKEEIIQELSAWDEESGFSASDAVAVPPPASIAQTEPPAKLPPVVALDEGDAATESPDNENKTALDNNQADDPFSSWLTKLQDQKRAQQDQLASLQSQKSDVEDAAANTTDSLSERANTIEDVGVGTEIARQTIQDQTPAPLPKLSNGVKAKRTATGGLIFTN